MVQSLRNRSLVLVMMTLLAFFALWMRDLGYPALSGDEAFVAMLTARPAGEILQQLNIDEPHPPVYYLLMHGWQTLVGDRPELLIRYPSLLIGLLLLSLTYRLGREIGLGRLAAVVPMVLIGFDPQITAHVREARMYGPMVVSIAFLVLIGLRFERLPRRGAIWIAAVASLLALLTHYFNVFFVAAVGLWGLLVFDRATRRRWFISQVAAWVALAIWLPLLGRGFLNSTNLSQGKMWSFVLPLWDTLARLIKVAMSGYRDVPDLWVIVLGGVLLIAGWLAGSLHSEKRQRWLLLLGVGVPLIVYALLAWFKPVFHPKYMLPWILFTALAVGSWVAQRPRLGGSLCLGLLVLMAGPTWRTIVMPYDPGVSMSHTEWLVPLPRLLSQGLVELAGPTDVFGFGTPDDAHCYYSNYYFERKLGCELLPRYPTQAADELAGQVKDLLSKHAVLWYRDFYNVTWDPNHVADQAFARAALNLGTDVVGGSKLRLYTSPDTVVRNQQTSAARFGNAAELEGVWIVRGNALHVVLIWRALADHPMVDAKVFIHLLDGSGQIVAQDDGVPVSWTRPLNTWQRNEQLLDVHTLSLPAEAQLNDWSLRVGLYDQATTIRLPAVDSTGNGLPDNAVTLPLAMWIDGPTRSAGP